MYDCDHNNLQDLDKALNYTISANIMGENISKFTKLIKYFTYNELSTSTFFNMCLVFSRGCSKRK